jgi:RES domain-containing protein
VIQAWRIVHKRFAENAFSGEGPYLYGGRWNSPGHRVVYVSQSISLATLEVLVNGLKPEQIHDYIFFSIMIPVKQIQKIEKESLPDDWNNDPVPHSTQAVGDKWFAKRKSLALQVPSAVVVQEYNFLLNPLHPEFAGLKIGPAEYYSFDHRLF